MAYLTAQRILFDGNKAELSRQTGINLRTIFNRRDHPEKTTAANLKEFLTPEGVEHFGDHRGTGRLGGKRGAKQ